MWGIEPYFVWVWVILWQCGLFWVGKGSGAFFWVSTVGCWCMGLYFGWVGVSGIEWSIVLCRGRVDGWETFFRWVRVGGSEGRWVEVGGCVGTVWYNASLKKTHFTKYLEISKMKFECLYSYIRISSENIRIWD